MVNTLPAFAAPLLPILWALIATIYWRNSLSRPLLFLLTSALALIGIQAVLSSLWDFSRFVGVGIAGSPHPSEAEVRDLLEYRNHVAMGEAIVVLITAVPFLWSLKNGFSCGPSRDP